MRACMFSAAFAAVMTVFLALPAAAQNTSTDQQHSPVFSGIANMVGGTSGSSAKAAAPEAEKEKRPRTREEYRAAREARKEAERLGLDKPLPEDMFFDQSTGQYKKVIQGKSGGSYITSTTCYEIAHQGGGTRVFRPVACIMPAKKDK